MKRSLRPNRISNPEHGIDCVMEVTIDESKTNVKEQFKEAKLVKTRHDYIELMSVDFCRVRRSRHPHTLQVKVKWLRAYTSMVSTKCHAIGYTPTRTSLPRVQEEKMRPHLQRTGCIRIQFITKTSSKQAGHLSPRSHLSHWRNTQSGQLSLRELVEPDMRWGGVHWWNRQSRPASSSLAGRTERPYFSTDSHNWVMFHVISKGPNRPVFSEEFSESWPVLLARFD